MDMRRQESRMAGVTEDWHSAPSRQRITKLVDRSCQRVLIRESTEEWMEFLFSEPTPLQDFDLTVVFLLSMLPNLETFCISTQSHPAFDFHDEVNLRAYPKRDFYSVDRLLDLLVRQANDPSLTDQPLAKLRAVATIWDDAGEAGGDLAHALPLLSFPK
jgi:hypothetical protein